MLYRGVREAPLEGVSGHQALSAHFAEFEAQFFTRCDRQLQKIDTFFSGREHAGY